MISDFKKSEKKYQTAEEDWVEIQKSRMEEYARKAPL